MASGGDRHFERALRRLSKCKPVDDHTNQNNDTCARIRSISSGSSMRAITLKRPPQRSPCSISIPSTRFRRRAQFSATCFGDGRSDVRLRASDPRPAGVIVARSAALAAVI